MFLPSSPSPSLPPPPFPSLPFSPPHLISLRPRWKQLRLLQRGREETIAHLHLRRRRRRTMNHPPLRNLKQKVLERVNLYCITGFMFADLAHILPDTAVVAALGVDQDLPSRLLIPPPPSLFSLPPPPSPSLSRPHSLPLHSLQQ